MFSMAASSWSRMGVEGVDAGRGPAGSVSSRSMAKRSGEIDEFGLPVRHNWAAEYRVRRVVYGHTPVPEPEWLNRTINIDTGCVFGGRLTALRYPERELVSVPAASSVCGTREAVSALLRKCLGA